MHRQDWIPGSFVPGVPYLPVHSTTALQIFPSAPVNHIPHFPQHTYLSYNQSGGVNTPLVQNFYTIAPFAASTTQYYQNNAIHPRVFEPSVSQIRLIPPVSIHTTASTSERQLRPSQRIEPILSRALESSVMQIRLIPSASTQVTASRTESLSSPCVSVQSHKTLLSRQETEPKAKQPPSLQTEPNKNLEPDQQVESIPQQEIGQPSEQNNFFPSPPPFNKKIERLRMELALTPPPIQDSKGTPPDGKMFPSRRKSCQPDS